MRESKSSDLPISRDHISLLNTTEEEDNLNTQRIYKIKSEIKLQAHQKSFSFDNRSSMVRSNLNKTRKENCSVEDSDLNLNSLHQLKNPFKTSFIQNYESAKDFE